MTHDGEEFARFCSYLHSDAGAVTHMYASCSGAWTPGLGEPQILGQMKDACNRAHRRQPLGPYLDSAVSKHLRYRQAACAPIPPLARIGLSVAFAAGHSLSRQIFSGT